MTHVGWIKINHIVNAVFRHKVQKFFGEFAVRVDYGYAPAGSDIGNRHIFQEIGFACAGLADNVHMPAPVVGFNAEPCLMVSESCFAK
jgi:hypothetical protein